MYLVFNIVKLLSFLVAVVIYLSSKSVIVNATVIDPRKIDQGMRKTVKMVFGLVLIFS